MRTALRIVAQLVLTGPIYLLGVFAWPFLIVPFMPSFWTKFSFSGFAMVSGAYGILALPFSIFLPLTLVHRSKWISVALVFFLAGGCLTSLSTIFGAPQTDRTVEKTLKEIWIFGGPIVVAVWNTARFIKRPNQTQSQPTGGSS